MKDFILSVHVIPDSRESEVKGLDEWSHSLKVKVRGKAMKGKANTELEKKFNRPFEIKNDLLLMDGKVIMIDGSDSIKMPLEVFVDCEGYMGINPEIELLALVSDYLAYYKKVEEK